MHVTEHSQSKQGSEPYLRTKVTSLTHTTGCHSQELSRNSGTSVKFLYRSYRHTSFSLSPSYVGQSVCIHVSKLQYLTYSSPGFHVENTSSQKLHVVLSSFFVSMSGVDSFSHFFDFDPQFPKKKKFSSRKVKSIWI
jgi:hypothetical protein